MPSLADLLRLNDGEQAYVGYPQMNVGLNKPRQAGATTGFLEGATGMPSMQPKNPITDPNFESYEQGKNIGEAANIAAMALPGYATALRAAAPKAYNALENYMVKTGGMIPLEAYHGTPHTIEGKFDISKVGTGEGAQAYGHGMYFAENPKVAGEYQKMVRGPEQTAQEYLKMYKTPEQAISVLENGIKPNLTPEAKKHSLDAIEVLKSGKELKGNLYKVDIPDEYIPNMLDWDKPLHEQSAEVKKALANVPHRGKNWTFKDTIESLEAAPHLREDVALNPTGSQIYSLLGDSMMVGNKAPGQVEASKKLNELGIKGIKYLDEGSRGLKTGIGHNAPKYTAYDPSFGGHDFNSLKEAEDFVKDNPSFNLIKPTSNFVVFDPSEVQILEKNSQPVSRKEILTKEANKLLK